MRPPPVQRFQITTDGFQPYVSAIATTLSDRCDYAMHIKVYGTNPEEERRYSPAEVISSEKVKIMGNLEKARICTSHVERQNLTIRMQMRRMTRLTNAFSKKWDNLWSAYCLHLLQLLPDVQNLAHYPGDGSADCGSCMRPKRTTRLARRTLMLLTLALINYTQGRIQLFGFFLPTRQICHEGHYNFTDRLQVPVFLVIKSSS